MVGSRSAIAGETRRPRERCAGVGYPTPRTLESIEKYLAADRAAG